MLAAIIWGAFVVAVGYIGYMEITHPIEHDDD